MALPSTETQRSRITSVYAALAAHNFSQLRQDAEFVDQLEALDLALVKELHPNLVEIERAYEAFRQDLVLYKLWERLHLYRALGEFRLGQREQIASQLFSAVTRHIMLATDACETARVDLFHFGDGIIIRFT